MTAHQQQLDTWLTQRTTLEFWDDLRAELLEVLTPEVDDQQDDRRKARTTPTPGAALADAALATIVDVATDHGLDTIALDEIRQRA